MKSNFFIHPSLKNQYEQGSSLSIETGIPRLESTVNQIDNSINVDPEINDNIDISVEPDIKKRLLKFGVIAAGIVVISVVSLLVIKKTKK